MPSKRDLGIIQYLVDGHTQEAAAGKYRISDGGVRVVLKSIQVEFGVESNELPLPFA